jgi:fumarylacetoacetase
MTNQLHKARTMPHLDETHDPKRRSWVASANGHSDFPIQNLSLGVFTPPNGGPRGGAPAPTEMAL